MLINIYQEIQVATILIIEDDPDLRTDLIEIFIAEGFSAIAVADAFAGLQQIKEIQPDALLCDIHLSAQDNFDAIEILRQEARAMNIPFIFLTAQPPAVIERAQRVFKPNAIVTKPFDVPGLFETVRTHLH